MSKEVKTARSCHRTRSRFGCSGLACVQRLALPLGTLDNLLQCEAFPRRDRGAIPDEHGVLHPQLCPTLTDQRAREECAEGRTVRLVVREVLFAPL